jgi:hypothetical protein
VTTRRFVTEGGVISKARGLGALEVYLRRTRVADAPWLDRLAFAELLEATDALPEGFSAEALARGLDPNTGEPASIPHAPAGGHAHRHPPQRADATRGADPGPEWTVGVEVPRHAPPTKPRRTERLPCSPRLA